MTYFKPELPQCWEYKPWILKLHQSVRQRLRDLHIEEELDEEPNNFPEEAAPDVFSCAVYGEIDSLKTLIESESPFNNINCKDSYGSSLLMEAARYGHLNIVEYLLGKGSDVDAINLSNQTALHFACGGGYDNVVTLLLERKANPDMKDVDGKTALHWASKN
eukprot:746886_1